MLHDRVLLKEALKRDKLQREILDLLTLHYGFTSALPVPTSLPHLTSEADRKKLVHMLGLSWTQCQDMIADVPCAGLAKSYLDGILAGKMPACDACDFNSKSQVSESMSQCLQSIQLVQVLNDESVAVNPATLYMFDFGHRGEVPWKLMVTNACDALLICQIDPQFSELNIAAYLLDHGIPFCTFLPLEITRSAPAESLPPCVLPVRLSDVQFSHSDYDHYAQQRDLLLNQCRARAAVMRGGFMWRLSVPL
ncbi:hypothetical protein H0H87_012079, partial [Tephrocybe sp. NHM501043]